MEPIAHSLLKINLCWRLELERILEPIDLDLSAYHIAIVKPNIHVSTVEAYSGVTPKESSFSLKDLIKFPVNQWKLQNDFEKSIFAKHTAIESLKNSLYKNGAVYAAMSGSGSSVFGLFENRPNLNYVDSSVFLV